MQVVLHAYKIYSKEAPVTYKLWYKLIDHDKSKLETFIPLQACVIKQEVRCVHHTPFMHALRMRFSTRAGRAG